MNASPPRSQPRGVAALAHYVEMRTKQPMLNLGASVHSIHLGTEYAAEITFFDIADAVNSHASLKARIKELEHKTALNTFHEMCKRVDVLEGALRDIRAVVHTPTNETRHRKAQDHFQADFDAIRKAIAAALPKQEPGA